MCKYIYIYIIIYIYIYYNTYILKYIYIYYNIYVYVFDMYIVRKSSFQLFELSSTADMSVIPFNPAQFVTAIPHFCTRAQWKATLGQDLSSGPSWSLGSYIYRDLPGFIPYRVVMKMQ